MSPAVRTIDELEVAGKRVLLRVDINSPIDPKTGRIADETRIDKSLATIRDLSAAAARLVIIAHQGDTLDYHNLISLREHADKLTEKLGRPVYFIDDVAGPAAREKIRTLEPGEVLLLENLRFLTEEVSTFEAAVKLTAAEMTGTYLVRSLAPLFDLYVNDAFAAAHRNSPSMVAFQKMLPFAAGRLLTSELEALDAVTGHPARPCVFVLGGLKISDAFSMLSEVLASNTADLVLTSGVTGLIMLAASGYRLGPTTEQFFADRSLNAFIPEAEKHLAAFPDRIRMPLDLATEKRGLRVELPVTELPVSESLIDIGAETIAEYETVISEAATVFVNGPAGVYERAAGEEGTRRLWAAVAMTAAVTVIGGGDTVASAQRFIDTSEVDFVSTGGGALIRHLSGQRLPLLEAMEVSALGSVEDE